MSDDTTSQSSQSANGLVIPADTQQRFGDLIDLIKQSESMNDEERQYWINILPIMTPDQVQNLRGILENERRQLQEIDDKYAKEMERLGQPELIQKMETERRRRREERAKQEQAHQSTEAKEEQDILEQIENA